MYTQSNFSKKIDHVVSVDKVTGIFSGGFLSCWLPASSANDRAYNQYAFGVPYLNSRVVEFVEMVLSECWSCYTDCSCLLFFSETFLDLSNAFSVI